MPKINYEIHVDKFNIIYFFSIGFLSYVKLQTMHISNIFQNV